MCADVTNESIIIIICLPSHCECKYTTESWVWVLVKWPNVSHLAHMWCREKWQSQSSHNPAKSAGKATSNAIHFLTHSKTWMHMASYHVGKHFTWERSLVDETSVWSCWSGSIDAAHLVECSWSALQCWLPSYRSMTATQPFIHSFIHQCSRNGQIIEWRLSLLLICLSVLSSCQRLVSIHLQSSVDMCVYVHILKVSSAKWSLLKRNDLE